KPQRNSLPLTYYYPTGPLGAIFHAFERPPTKREVAVVGLGTGSTAYYGQEGQRFTFFEIDSAVVKVARNPKCFTFVEDCRARVELVLGDARLSLANEPDRKYGLIVLDAFSSDAIPVHLLTREALQLYFAKLEDDGILALHVSNRYLDLHP